MISPWKVFNYIFNRNERADFTFMCIISDKKWNQFKNHNELIDLQNRYHNLQIKNVNIKNPNNPSLSETAKLITYEINRNVR